MFKMAKNWCGKKLLTRYRFNDCNCFSLLLRNGLSLTRNFIFSAAGNAFSQAASLHLQMQSKHDAATNFIDAGNAFKKADPQGKNLSLSTLGFNIKQVMLCHMSFLFSQQRQ